jgi:hypothetical protein
LIWFRTVQAVMLLLLNKLFLRTREINSFLSTKD